MSQFTLGQGLPWAGVIPHLLRRVPPGSLFPTFVI